MGDKIIMSEKERARKAILESVKQGHTNLSEASKRLKVSYRQCKRIWKRYKEEQDQGLVHKLRGRISSKAFSLDFQDLVIQRYQEHYLGFGPTLATEKLEELDSIKLSAETLRKWLIKEGLWHRRRKRKAHRQRRARKPRFGELLQIDGSIHDWFGDGKEYCLLNIVDDATGTTLSQVDTGETTRILFQTLWLWILKYGIPQAVYVDLKSLYISPKNLKAAESDDTQHLNGGFSAFQWVCQKLHIDVIKAYSPQAKGRVERNHGVYQDRFVKELKLQGISTPQGANYLLLNEYLDKINNKFAKPPLDEIDGHRTLENYVSLKEIFCWEYARQVQNDHTIRFKNQFYQVLKNQNIKVTAKSKVTVRVYLDETIGIWKDGQKLAVEPIAERPKVTKQLEKVEYTSQQRSLNARKNKSKTPWSRCNPDWLKCKNNFQQLDRNAAVI